MCRSVRNLALESPDVAIVWPVHLNPTVQALVYQSLGGLANLHLLPPLPYLRFLQVLLAARLVITDSGGVQEEAAALGIPFLVARRTTERPEGIEAGIGELVDPETGALLDAVRRLLTDEVEYRRRAVPTLAFGAGSAGTLIARDIIHDLLLAGTGPTRANPQGFTVPERENPAVLNLDRAGAG